MAKVVYRSLKSSNPERKPSGVTSKRVKSSDGQIMTIHTVDAASSTFGEDISYVFRQNVKKARRENLKVANTSDRVATKD